MTQYQEAKINSKKVIAEAKVRQWTELANSEQGKDLTYLYRKIKELKGNFRRPSTPLVVQGERFYAAQDKANVLVKTFAEASRLEGLTEEMRPHRNKAEETPITPKTNMPEEQYNKSITMAELDNTLRSITKTKVSEGPDKISYRQLKQLSPKYKEKVLSLFNIVWNSGEVPSAWKETIIKPIPKAGKPKQDPSSFRPIALTSHLGKVFERIIKDRLNYHCEKHRVIPVCQAGFRKGRGVTDHLAKLASHVRRARARKKTMLACLFDVRRAYDSVWHHRLLQRIQEVGIHGRMFNFVNSFINNRCIRVNCEGAISDTRVLHMGVPQGSVVAPLLFNIITSKVASCKQEDCDIMAYADDVAIIHETKIRRMVNLTKDNTSLVRSKMLFQKQINAVTDFMNTNGFTLAPNKTQLIVITTANYNVNHPMLKFKVNDTVVHPQKEVTYLGVTFSDRGTWNSHIKGRVSQASKALGIIKAMSRIPWAAKSDLLVTLVQTLVRSRLLYGIEAFFSTSEHQISKLVAVECQALKIALGVPKCTANHLVYREAGLLPFEEEIKRRCANYLTRCLTVENSTKLEDLNEPKHSHFHDIKKDPSMTEFVKELDPEGIERVAPRPGVPSPPWEAIALPIQTNLHNISKKDNPSVIGAIANEFIETFPESANIVYTDGSLGSRGAGAAFWASKTNHSRKFNLGNTSVFTSELVAILMALNYIQTIGNTNPWVILTDSKSVATSLSYGGGQAREGLIKSAITLLQRLIGNSFDITIQWVPAHVGIPGNTKVDLLAKEAANGKEAIPIAIPPESNDFKNKFKTRAWEAWSRRFRDLISKKPTIDPRLPEKGLIRLGGAPLLVQTVMRRLRCNTWKTKFVELNCECGAVMSLTHALLECHLTPPQAHDTKDLRDIVAEHPVLGWQPLRNAAEALLRSPLATHF
jgi:ribonuclease HI